VKRRLYTDQYIVITGGAGLLGSEVVHQLNQAGYQNLVIVDSFDRQPKWRYLVGSQVQEVLLPGELHGWLEGRGQQIEAILHLGSKHEFSGATPNQLLDNNYRQSITLAEYALKHNIRFIYSSCAQTYGDGSNGFTASLEVLPKLQPLSLTGFSHHLFDLWCLHQQIFDQVVCCKIFDLIGLNDLHKPAEMQIIRRMAQEIISTGAVTLLESPQPDLVSTEAMARDFIDVRDAAQRLIAFLKNDACGVFNVGSGTATQWSSLAAHLFHLLQRPERLLYRPMPNHMALRTQLITCADLSQSKKCGLNVVCTPLEDSLKWILQGLGLVDEDGHPVQD
jgi:ADP-L-glycero-D-manno-heptose 6-epimerase